MKRVVILQHSGGLCNQLWNLVAIQAYCIEKGYELIDYSSLDYKQYLDLPKLPSNFHTMIFRLMLFLDWAAKMKKKDVRRYLRFAAYTLRESVRDLSMRFCAPIVEPKLYSCFYLPPSANVLPDYDEMLKRAEQSETLYLKGWLFRNSIGLVKHREGILSRLRFKQEHIDAARQFLESNGKGQKYLVGLHVRKGDFRAFAGGVYWFDEYRVRPLIDEYLRQNNLDYSEVRFVLCSDDAIDTNAFAGLDFIKGPGKELDDLLVLSLCDLIMSSNSSYSGFASYLGDVPRIIFQDKVDWDYYKGKAGYFEDKHFSFNLLDGASALYLER